MPTLNVTATATAYAHARAVAPLLKASGFYQYAVSASSVAFASSSVPGYHVTPFPVTATAHATAGVHASAVATGNRPVSATASAVASATASNASARVYAVTATASAVASASAPSAAAHVLPVTAVASASASVSASAARNRVISVSAHAGATASASPTGAASALAPVSARAPALAAVSASVNGVVGVSARAPASAHASASVAASHVVVAHAGATAASHASLGRTFAVAGLASASAAATAPRHSNFFFRVATASAAAHAGVTAVLVGPNAAASASAAVAASVSVILPDGTTLPGGSANAGLQLVLAEGLSGSAPFTSADLPDGTVVLANGLDPMLVWNPLARTARSAGLPAPPRAPALGGTGVGTIAGDRVAYVRYLDAAGRPSPLSPVSNVVPLGFEGLVDDLACNPSTGVVTVTSRDHGLASGEVVVFRDVRGLETLNGAQAVTALDHDRFTVFVPATGDTWTEGGSWVWGVASVVYTGVAPPTDPRVARRQLLRSLEGTLDALYVDIDTDDLASTAFSSALTDEQLAAGECVPLTDPETGLPLADLSAPPPGHKAVVAAHAGRVFAAVDAAYSAGCVLPVPGRSALAGVGTAWTAALVGRSLFVGGCPAELTVTAVDPAAQVLTYSGAMPAADTPYALYSVRPPAAERKLVYYSEPGTADAWPPWNCLQVPEDGDVPVGLFSAGAYLYVVERRHLYRVVVSASPSDAGVYLAARRGAVNHRCIVRAEGRALMLDAAGVHAFDDDQADKHLSAPVQTLWHQSGGLQIDLAADTTLWHGVYDPARETARWFVTLVGYAPLTTAICYHARPAAGRQNNRPGSHPERWWVEQYPWPVTSSAACTVGYRRALAGTEGRRVLALWEGALDAAPDSGTVRGTATAGTATTLTDSGAAFAPNLAGVPVALVAGTGRGQVGVVASNTATALTVKDAWAVTPDATSVYQVGGVPWSWRSGWYAYADDQAGNPRDIALTFPPLARPATLDMALYFDHSLTPANEGWGQSDDGVTTTAGSPYVTVDLARAGPRPGYAVKRAESHADDAAYGDSYVSLELSGVQGPEAVVVYHVVISGVREDGAENLQ